MEPVTHVLTGICLARASRGRRVLYATAAMAVAAEFPDVDVLWGLDGPVAAFQHHRGITHTFVGVVAEAALLLAFCFGLHRARMRRAQPGQLHERQAGQSPRWLLLYLGILVALLSHLWLDYTNSYGLRPFFPFYGRWFAGSFVFIVDPLLLLVLASGLLLPALFRLVEQEVRGARVESAGTGWARTALIVVALIWCFRFYEHRRALILATEQVLRAPAAVPEGGQALVGEPAGSEPETRLLLSPVHSLATPDLLDPFRWYAANDFGPAFQTYRVETRNGAVFPERVLSKPPLSKAVLAAERSPLGRAYLDWSLMPVILSLPAMSGAGTSGEGETVLFEDLRFVAASPWLQRGSATPLSGKVVLDRENHVVQQIMSGRADH